MYCDRRQRCFAVRTAKIAPNHSFQCSFAKSLICFRFNIDWQKGIHVRLKKKVQTELRLLWLPCIIDQYWNIQVYSKAGRAYKRGIYSSV